MTYKFIGNLDFHVSQRVSIPLTVGESLSGEGMIFTPSLTGAQVLSLLNGVQHILNLEELAREIEDGGLQAPDR